MLSAQRDPIPGHGTPDGSSAPRPSVGPHQSANTPAFTRFIAGVQILATMLAIPVGLASGYSIYRANFSPEAKCGTLRANIISMLDKNADASTLRLLVRRDVATFERSCASVDPDAVAAFKALLVKPAPVAVAAPNEAKRAPAARPEPAKRVVAKTAIANKTASPKAAPAKPAHSNADADWLAEVRRALVKHGPVTHAVAADAPLALSPPTGQPMGQPLPVQTQAAPPLPPTASVADAPAPRAQVDRNDDHPVPPAPIPNVGSPGLR